MENSSAILAGCVIVIITVVTYRYGFIPTRIALPDSVIATFAYCGMFIKTTLTHNFVVKLIHIPFTNYLSAIDTSFFV